MRGCESPSAQTLRECHLTLESPRLHTDPITSLAAAQQAIGRASRLAPGKESGYCLVTVLSGEGEDAAEKLAAGAYAPVCLALLAMAEGDPMLKRAVVFAADEEQRRGQPMRWDELPAALRERVDLPASWGGALRAQLAGTLLKEVRLDGGAWEAGFAAVEAYREAKGDALVPQRHVTADGLRLGQWVTTQRSARRKGELSEARAARLEAVDGWQWRVR